MALAPMEFGIVINTRSRKNFNRTPIVKNKVSRKVEYVAVVVAETKPGEIDSSRWSEPVIERDLDELIVRVIVVVSSPCAEKL